VGFTTEPLVLDTPPRHAVVAGRTVRAAGLDAVDVGPFGSAAEGAADAVLDAVRALLAQTLEAGATRVTVQVNVVPEGEEAPRGRPGEDGA
jgi:hypothetical protein